MEKKINIVTILNIIIYWIFWAIIYYFSWILWVLENSLTIIFITIFAFLIYFSIKKIFRSKKILDSSKFINRFLLVFWIFLSIIFSLFSFLIYYWNENPAKMPEYTLTNWDKTVVFQGMIHIWSENFYKNISNNLKKYKENWFLHFFEWVKQWTKENQEKFNKIIWFNFDKKLYENMWKLLWVTNQNYEKIIWEISEKDVNVDLSLDEIIAEYEKSWIKAEKEISEKEILNISWELDNVLQKLNSRELWALQYIYKWIFNLILQDSEFLESKFSFWDENLTQIILQKRNEKLANEIINSKEKKFYVTYWLLHFDWIFKILQKNDKNWKIKETNYLYPFK